MSIIVKNIKKESDLYYASICVPYTGEAVEISDGILSEYAEILQRDCDNGSISVEGCLAPFMRTSINIDIAPDLDDDELISYEYVKESFLNRLMSLHPLTLAKLIKEGMYDDFQLLKEIGKRTSHKTITEKIKERTALLVQIGKHEAEKKNSRNN